MSALRGITSLLAGVGAGLLKGQETKKQNERQAKIDARADWEHQQKVEGVNRENKLRTEVADASMQRTGMQGTVTESGGQKLFSADPGQAAQLKSMTESMAEMEGTGPVTQTQGAAITGNMSKGHEITAGPLNMEKLKALNSPEAESERVQQVYKTHGLRDKAMQEFNAFNTQRDLIEGRKKKLETEGVTTALSMLRAGDPAAAMQAFQSSGSMKLPEGSIFEKTDGTDMWTGKPGKVWSIKVPDGNGGFKVQVPDVGETVAKYLGLEGMLGQDAARAKALLDGEKLELEKRKVEATEKKNDAMVYKLMGGGAGGGAGGSGGRGGSSGGTGGSVGLKERRDFIKDYRDIDEGATTEALTQAQGIFDTNAGFGVVLTAPQAMTAKQLSLDPANVKLVRDNQTGQTYETVVVNGQPIVVGLAQPRPPAPAPQDKPKAPPAAGAPVAPRQDMRVAVAPRPTLEQIQAQTRQNRAQILQQSENAKAANSDPAIQALWQRHAQALRSGRPVEANAIAEQIKQVKAQRYGVQ